MMPNITTGGDTSGLIYYLLGPGRENEHTDQKIVAGNQWVEANFGDFRELDITAAFPLAMDLDDHMDRAEKYPRGKRTSWNYETGKMENAGVGPNHVWHCSLSISPEGGTLTDEKWREIAHDFVAEMGIATGSSDSDCMWVAIRHGKSKNDNDHIHIVANRVGADGSVWSNYRDWPRSQGVCTILEQRHGLEVLESRINGRGAIHDSTNEYNQARDAGASETYRATLESKLRIAATAATSEADFVTQLKAVGLRCKPFFEKGRTDVINGYSIALPSSQIPKGIDHEWRAPSKISKDLGLRVLRTRWEDTPTSATEAAEAWRTVWNSNKEEWKQRPLTEGEKAAQLDAAAAFSNRLKTVNPHDPEQLANASADIAGALAAIAANPDAGRVAWEIRSLSRRVAHDAQLRVRSAEKDVRFPTAKLASRLLMTAAASGNSTATTAILISSVVELVVELSALYRQANQANTAARLERIAAEALNNVQASYSYNPWLEGIEYAAKHSATITSEATLQGEPVTVATTVMVEPSQPAATQQRPTQQEATHPANANTQHQSQEGLAAKPAAGDADRTQRISGQDGEEVQILTGQQLPPQYHLGRQCRADWVRAQDISRGEHALCAKPTGALWTSSAIGDQTGRVATAWSQTYYRRAYDDARRASMSRPQALRAALTPERQWAVIPDADARIVRLDSAPALRAAASRWPGEDGRISFEAMAADGIDGVWVTTGAIPSYWSSHYWDLTPDASVYGQFHGWEVESVAWLRPDHLQVGAPSKAAPYTERLKTQDTFLDIDQAAKAAKQARNPWLEESWDTADALTTARTEETMNTEKPERPHNPWLEEEPPTANQSAGIGADESAKLDSLNPTGSVQVEYDPSFRAEAPLAENMVPLSTTEAINADEMITVYRGVPAGEDATINPGDYITTNPQLAADYAGTGQVIQLDVPAADILDDANEPGGEEYIYRPQTEHDPETTMDVSNNDELWDRIIEAEAQSFTEATLQGADPYDLAQLNDNLPAETDTGAAGEAGNGSATFWDDLLTTNTDENQALNETLEVNIDRAIEDAWANREADSREGGEEIDEYVDDIRQIESDPEVRANLQDEAQQSIQSSADREPAYVTPTWEAAMRLADLAGPVTGPLPGTRIDSDEDLEEAIRRENNLSYEADELGY